MQYRKKEKTKPITNSNHKFKKNQKKNIFSSTKMKPKIFKKLLPWFISISIYFTIYPNSKNEDTTYLLIKLLPMLSLCLFIHLVGGLNCENDRLYSRRIFYGLLFSTIGDGLLVFKK